MAPKKRIIKKVPALGEEGSNDLSFDELDEEDESDEEDEDLEGEDDLKEDEDNDWSVNEDEE